jgi:hypothetical protein
MSFKVKDLSVSLSGFVDTDPSTCPTMTKTSCVNSLFWQDGASRQHNLSTLQAELRRAMMRS